MDKVPLKIHPKLPLYKYVRSAFFAFLFIAILMYLWWTRGDLIGRLISDREFLENWLAQHKAKAPIVFMLLQALQVIVFFLPGESTQIAGGYLFGIWWGLLWSSLGIAFGSLIAFFSAKFFGRPFVELIISEATLKKFDYLMHHKTGLLPVIVLFLIPGIPKDILCYIVGLTPINFFHFFIISFIGRLPGIILSTLFGHSLAEENYFLFFIILGVILLTIIVGIFYRKEISQYAEDVAGNNKNPKP
jgi:uncharacterized membrane protein YdjX (TVP38/TMEM64 family)